MWLQTRFEISKSYFEQQYPQLQIYLSWTVVLLKHTRFQNGKKNCFEMKKLLTSPNHPATPAHTALTPFGRGGGGHWRWVLCKEVPVVVGCKTDPHKAKALVTTLREMGWHPWPTTGAGRWRGPWAQWPSDLPRVRALRGSGCGWRGVWTWWPDPGRPPARSPRPHILVQPVRPGATWRRLQELHLQDLTFPEPCAQNPHPSPLPCPSQWQQPVAVITKMTSLVQNFFHEINHCRQSRCHKPYTDSDTLEKGHL